MAELSLEQASRAQRMAADPSGTRLAAANAGSGKTRVLVSRVSRILLKGTPPEKILCLTYTKAAAAEMQERLFTTLGGWSVSPDEDLRRDLTELFGHAPEQEVPPVKLSAARELFAKALETPEGLKVQTIHAFCERILSRFPIEAGIMPGFEPLDDREQANLRAEVEAQMLNVAAVEPDGPIARALRVLTLAKADMALEPVFGWMANSPRKIADWVCSGRMAALAEALDLGNARTESEVATQFLAATQEATLETVAAAFATGAKTDQDRANIITAALRTADPQLRFAKLSSLWFTQGGSPRKSFANKTTDPVAKDWVEQMADEAIRTQTRIKAVRLQGLTQAVHDIAADYASAYAAAKRKVRGLDYNDQILMVRDLLNLSEAAEWVRYKLDGGIDHILVDEAQDTAPEQWDIINALAAPFFEPSPDADPNSPRTLFAVGDEKQSIYGFQGAKPERFLSEIRETSDRADTAGQDVRTDIRMRMSFRSAQQVLDVVDAVFLDQGGRQAMFDAEGFPPATDDIRHVAHRSDPGRVEIWPIQPRPPAPVEAEIPWDTTPLDELGQGHPVEVLAGQIAAQIKFWLDTGEPVYDRDLKRTRPMRPEDILILVRRRSEIFHAIIRHLKRCEVPIGGADRIALAEATVVQDMLSLTRFCLLPSDDLSLAEVLKSPFFGWTDEDLMAVAIDRGAQTLWQAVQTERPEVATPLQRIIDLSLTLTPYDFYTRVLDMSGRSGTMRERLFKRLSMEARDALEAFLDRALDHQTRQAPSLHHFLREIAGDDGELKREPEGVAREVRVMTVHGAKGLEAPVVFLPDTTSVPTLRDALLPDGEGFLFQVASGESVPHHDEAVARATARMEQEQLRLLYVAMTRAESRLVVCGHWYGRSKTGLKDGSWYDWIDRAMSGLETQAVPCPTTHERDGGLLTGRAYGRRPAPAAPDNARVRTVETALPPWISVPAKREDYGRRVTPSHLLSNPPVEMAVRSPGRVRNRAGALRGTVIHRLLEILPDYAPERRDALADRVLSGYDDLPDGFAADVKANVFGVLDDPAFASIFAPGSRAEVSLAGSSPNLPDGLYLNAQIDRLRVTDTEVVIIDYKSNRPPPQKVEDVDALYLGQMAAYRELAREVYPGRTVTCALLWTDVPRMMILPPAILDEALRRIAALPTS